MWPVLERALGSPQSLATGVEGTDLCTACRALLREEAPGVLDGGVGAGQDLLGRPCPLWAELAAVAVGSSAAPSCAARRGGYAEDNMHKARPPSGALGIPWGAGLLTPVQSPWHLPGLCTLPAVRGPGSVRLLPPGTALLCSGSPFLVGPQWLCWACPTPMQALGVPHAVLMPPSWGSAHTDLLWCCTRAPARDWLCFADMFRSRTVHV